MTIAQLESLDPAPSAETSIRVGGLTLQQAIDCGVYDGITGETRKAAMYGSIIRPTVDIYQEL